MAKNLHVKIGSVDIAKRNLAKVTYPNTSTSLSKINRKIGSRANKEYWTKQSSVMTLTASVVQGERSKNWANADYTITENYTTIIITDSLFGKSYGEFEVYLYRVRNGVQTQLAHKSGRYGGYPMETEPIVPANTSYTVQKNDIIRVRVGASFNPDVSGQHTTTSWIKYYLT